jgi:hypothetical protein
VFPDRNDGLALAALVFGEAAVPAILGLVGGLHIAAEIAAIDLRSLAVAAQMRALHFGRRGLANFVSENPSRFGTSRSRERASDDLPLTSLQKITIAAR